MQCVLSVGVRGAPLTHPELFDEIGVKPPKGVILYGEPGTGKTLLAKAVANKTSATFLRLVGSELIQKYAGEGGFWNCVSRTGPKLVRDIFSTARDLAPSIVFIDEIDSIGTKRYDAGFFGRTRSAAHDAGIAESAGRFR